MMKGMNTFARNCKYSTLSQRFFTMLLLAQLNNNSRNSHCVNTCVRLCVYLILYYKQYKDVSVFGYKPPYKYTHTLSVKIGSVQATRIPSMKHVFASQYRQEHHCIQHIKMYPWLTWLGHMDKLDAVLIANIIQQLFVAKQHRKWLFNGKTSIYLYTFDPCSTVVPFDIHIDFSISNIAESEKTKL